ncbi:aminotransferase class V-fold PLP-dependent enzyme [Candidatus Poribacteria bacterium]|nr:aminotransferase class V-fold PLP-dependent enzyme [Candidatus Poribacteria bacterium]
MKTLFNDWQSEFPVTQKYVYMNHAGVAPLSKRVQKAMVDFVEDATVNGAVNVDNWVDTVEECRDGAADLLNADSKEIAFMKNTTQGILIAANGIDWKQGDNVVTTAVEFPANVYPWWSLSERFGVDTRMVPEKDGIIHIQDLIEAIDDRTRVLTISHVEFASGFRNDITTIGEICQERDIWFIVDAIQSLGVIELDVKMSHIDILAADGHKWMLAPEGAAIFYCSDRKRDKLINTNLGWAGVINPRDFLNYDITQKPDATRFEEGSYNTTGIYGLNAAIKLLKSVQIQNIEERVLQLTDSLISGLDKKGYIVKTSKCKSERAGIVIFESEKHTPTQLFNLLQDNNIITAERGSGIRISPHFYNTESEINQVLNILPDN